jgi:hypothetical protein
VKLRNGAKLVVRQFTLPVGFGRIWNVPARRAEMSRISFTRFANRRPLVTIIAKLSCFDWLVSRSRRYSANPIIPFKGVLGNC